MSYSAIFLQICKKFNIFCISTKYVEFCRFKVKKKVWKLLYDTLLTETAGFGGSEHLGAGTGSLIGSNARLDVFVDLALMGLFRIENRDILVRNNIYLKLGGIFVKIIYVLTLFRWFGKDAKTEGITPSLNRTVWPVLSKSACIKWSLQRTVLLDGLKSSLLNAKIQAFLSPGSLGNL